MRLSLLLLLIHLHGYKLVITGSGKWLGVTDSGAKTVTLFEYEGEPTALVRKVLAYETAHVIDLTCLTDTQRRSWQKLRHVRGHWYAPNLTPEQGTGAGDFADVFSAWATRSPVYFQDRPISAHNLRVLAHRFHFARGVCA